MSTDMCKHGHVDGVMHVPCYQCLSEQQERQLTNLQADLKAAWATARASDNAYKAERLKRDKAEALIKLIEGAAALRSITHACRGIAEAIDAWHKDKEADL